MSQHACKAEMGLLRCAWTFTLYIVMLTWCQVAAAVTNLHACHAFLELLASIEDSQDQQICITNDVIRTDCMWIASSTIDSLTLHIAE